jgi:tRNA 2-thiocytidine biosynthesis protein TtcA
MGHVVPSHLMDRNLHPFTTLQTTGVADPAGDRAFDEMDDCGTAAGAIIALHTPN